MLNVTPKPRLFIGSSVEGLPQAKAIQNNLNRRAQVTLWSQGVFKLNKTALQSLQEHLDKTDFAVFIFSPDDRTHIRGSDLATARDNCIFELGLSLGKLGNDRAFFVKPRGFEDFRIPSDLYGITAGEYEIDRDDENWQAAFSEFTSEIESIMMRLGRRQEIRDIIATNQRLNAQVHFLYSLVKNSKHFTANHNRVLENFLSSCRASQGFSLSAATLFSLIFDELVQIGCARDVDEGKRFRLDHNERYPENKSWVVAAFLSNKSMMAYKGKNAVRGEYEYIICIPIANTFVVTVHLITDSQVPEDYFDTILEEFVEKHNHAVIMSFNTFLERGVEAYVEQPATKS